LYEEALVSTAAVLVIVPLSLLLVYSLLRRGVEGPEHPLKRVRYEAGNPPRGAARVPVLYQYFGFMLVFVALDPVFMLLFILPTLAGEWQRAVALSMAMVGLILPPLMYAVRYATRKEQWIL